MSATSARILAAWPALPPESLGGILGGRGHIEGPEWAWGTRRLAAGAGRGRDRRKDFTGVRMGIIGLSERSRSERNVI